MALVVGSYSIGPGPTYAVTGSGLAGALAAAIIDPWPPLVSFRGNSYQAGSVETTIAKEFGWIQPLAQTIIDTLKNDALVGGVPNQIT